MLPYILMVYGTPTLVLFVDHETQQQVALTVKTGVLQVTRWARRMST